jgi:hypothetical protein
MCANNNMPKTRRLRERALAARAKESVLARALRGAPTMCIPAETPALRLVPQNESAPKKRAVLLPQCPPAPPLPIELRKSRQMY